MTSITADTADTADAADTVETAETTLGRGAARAGADDPGAVVRRRRAEAMAVFGTWVVIGLYVDGWAHQANKPETFFTPWHGVLYSGFLAGMAWSILYDLGLRRRGVSVAPDRLATIGFAAFAFGGVADMVWHAIFGIEQDVEALLSPSHLVLMAAGLLMVTLPLRTPALASAPGGPPSWAAFWPSAVGLTLAIAIISFFGQFASGLTLWDTRLFTLADGWRGDEVAVLGIVGILLSTVVLLGALVWAAGAWSRPPMGTFTLVFGATALLMSGLRALDEAALVVPVALGGLLADVLVARGVPTRAVAAAVPAVMWTLWLATFHAGWGLGWSAELSSGTVVFATLIGYGLALIATPRPTAGTTTVPNPG
jgi:hypothetical protein